jgi:hypothetical protein
MDRKKILILILALIVLVGGIFLIASQVNKKEKVNPALPTVTKTQSEIEARREELLSHKVAEKIDGNVAVFVGNIEAINQNIFTIKNVHDLIKVNVISNSTAVMDAGKNSQIANLKVGDNVDLTYDKTTKNVMIITIMKPTTSPMAEKK